MGIEIRNLNKRFGATVVCDHLNLDIPAGELVALLGPSGSGKTTLLRIIAGLEVPESGHVLFHGEDATSTSVRERNVGFVFQHYALFNHMTIFENVAFGLRVRPKPTRPSDREIKAKVTELLKLVQLDWVADRYPHQLSGGQRQRIALARALAVEPKVLLLDEPFGALDAKVRKELRRWLRRLHDEMHVTSVFVTHDQDEAMEVADRIVVMNHGVIEHVGTPMQVYRDPGTPFVADFVGRINVLPARLVQGGRVVFSDTAFECPHDGAPGSEVKIYLRPEDVLARPIADGDSNVFDAQIDKIEFLGSYCLVRVRADALGEHRLTVYLSLNFLSEQRLEVGARLPLRLLPERMRIFA